MKPKEENAVGVEQSNLGKEITTLQTSKGEKSTNKKNGLVDKIFNSIKGCGVAASVAVVAVVGSTMLVSSPTVQLVSLTVESTYVEYQLSVEEIDMQNDYAVFISTADKKVDSFPIKEDGLHENKVEGLKPEWEYTLTFVRIDEYLGETELLTETFQTKPESSPPQLPQPPPVVDYQLNVYDITLVGLDEVNIFFTYENLDETCLPELIIIYEDDTQTTVSLLTSDLNHGYARTHIDGNFVSLSVVPVIKFENSDDVIEFAQYNHTFEQTLDANVVVNTSNKFVTFYLKALTNDATRVQIVDRDLDEIVYDYYLYESKVNYYYDLPVENLVNYTLYLTNDDGQKVSNDFFATIDTSFSLKPQFQFNYKNPGDTGVTYNGDGTINIYIQTDFQTDNADLYYQIILGDYCFVSRETTFVATGLPNDNYPIIYDILMDVDGIAYSVYNVTPSGTVNEFDFDSVMYTTITDNTATIYIQYYMLGNINLASVRLKSSVGEEIFVDETDWKYDDYEYYISVQFTNDFEYVDVFAICNQSKYIMEQIQDYVGNVEQEITTRIYK